jgi:hypothetical protein
METIIKAGPDVRVPGLLLSAINECLEAVARQSRTFDVSRIREDDPLVRNKRSWMPMSDVPPTTISDDMRWWLQKPRGRPQLLRRHMADFTATLRSDEAGSGCGCDACSSGRSESERGAECGGGAEQECR